MREQEACQAERRTEYQIEYEIAELLKMRLFQRCHGLAAVLGALELKIGDLDGELRTDGRALYLDSERLKREFAKGSEGLCLELLHMLAHCLLGHPFRADRERGRDRAAWDMACDQAAWELVCEIWGDKDVYPKQQESLYVDAHASWETACSALRLAKASGDAGTKAGAGGDGSPEQKQPPEQPGHLEDWWRLQCEKLKQERAGGRKRRAGTALRRQSRRLVPASGHRGDYREILKGLSSFREDSRINPDEFQYAWYEYGLQTYGSMPLIEPLEYSEERKIEDLVLVIDTSGSCERELVRIFLEETKGILEQDHLFFRRFCLHIIQCDNRVQRDDRIESREDFEAYLRDLRITGGGGTDFRPAFERIGELLRAGEFRDLKGVLYFTDGCGLYPREIPDYEVYFVMLKDNYDTIDMPGWIHRLVLEEA